MSCYSCRAKVPFDNMLNHNIQKYYKVHSLDLEVSPHFLVRMLSGFVLLHFHIVFASGHYLIKESFLDFSNQFYCSFREKSNNPQKKKSNQQSPSVKILELF